MDKYKITSHKLIHHLDRLARWKNGENVFPIYVEVSLTSKCNCKCSFCAFDYVGGGTEISEEVLLNAIKDMGSANVKSVMFAGEGEPYLYKGLKRALVESKKNNIDTAVASNGVLLEAENISSLDYLEWIRLSINAGTASTYSKIHGVSSALFERVVNNLKDATHYKKSNHLKVTIGVQFLVLDENVDEIEKAANLFINECGCDYFVLKPYIQHGFSVNKMSFDKLYSEESLLNIEERVLKLNKNLGNKIIFRKNAFLKLKENHRGYMHCFGLPFFCEIASNGKIYTCGPYLKKEEFCYGDLNKNSFIEIWNSEERKKIVRNLETSYDVNSKCMKNCRLDEINKFLNELKTPIEHINFI